MSDYEITGPYQYKKDAHPCFRIDSGGEIIACVYVHNEDEETARERAEAMIEGLRRIGRVGVTRDDLGVGPSIKRRGGG